VHLAARLRAGGFVLLDAQFITDHLSQFGAEEISRRAYQARLDAALSASARFPAAPMSGADALAAIRGDPI
jgi:leucyl/phenylalanyl-tRNA--protein transferase